MEENENKLEEMAKEKAKNVGKETARTGLRISKNGIKQFLKSAIKLLFSKIGIIAAFIVIGIIIFISAISYVLEEDDAENVTGYGKYSINSVLELSDISELVTINGTPEEGYSLAFVEDIDEKLRTVIEFSDDYKEREITDPNILKQYIKAELVTQLPYLGEGVKKSKLPNLEGVDILYEPEESTNIVNSMEGMLMLGDSFTLRLHHSGLLEDGCQYYAEVGLKPKDWINKFEELPDSATGVCVLLGVNDPYQIKEMKKLIDKLVEKYQGKPVYVQKVFPLGKQYSYGNRDTIQKQIDKFNSEIEEYCGKQENVFWIDTTMGYVDDFGYLITNDKEGIHIDEDNQNILVSNIKSKILREYGATSASDSDELQGTTSKEAIWSYLIGKGFSEEATAGIMGNWQEESGLNSNSVQGDYEQSNPDSYREEMTKKFQAMTAQEFGQDQTGGGGYGLAQWTFSSRKEKLHNFAKEQGKDLDDLKMQLDFFIKECEETAEFQDILKDEFKKLDDIHKAAQEFHRIYESSGDGSEGLQERTDSGKRIWDELHGTVPSGTYSTAARKKAMAVTDREVAKENEFQAAVKLKRVIPDKDIGKISEAEGKVVEMNYVPEGVFNAYINQQNANVLEVFTINNNREIVFAKWSYDSDNGVKYSKASSVNIATVMEKYTMPYDYLMIFNVYGKDIDFCLGLADLAIKSEYIVAIQDQVTTTETTTTKQETVTSTLTDEAYGEILQAEIVKHSTSGSQVPMDEVYKSLLETIPRTTSTQMQPYSTTKIKETVSEKIDLTYADSWAITVHNEVTYKDEKEAKREKGGVASTQSDPISEEYTNNTETATNTTTTVTTVSTSSITNKYASGETTVEEEKGGDKFVELYKTAKGFKRVELSWLFEALNANAKTAKLVDLTKYLLYKANNENMGILEPQEVFAQYEDNKFQEVKKDKKGTVGWAFIRAWENNDLRKFMEEDETVEYDSTPNIYSCVTADKTKYILHDELDRAIGNRIYGIEVKSYDISLGYKWQNVNLFQEQGINIKESEYNIYGKSQIDVEIIEKISIEQWNSLKERVEQIAELKNVELESYQIDCLVDILYKKGSIYKIVDFYKNQENKDELNKEEFQNVSDEFKGARGEARWILFSEGKYPTPIPGEELDPADYAGGGGAILEVADRCWKWVCEHNPTYDGTSIPPTTTIDCSGFVTWVLFEMGYTEFSYQWCTQDFIDNKETLKSKYGWEIIDISQGEDISDIVQPGDIIDRSVGSGASGHMNIAVSCENGQLIAYDCGTEDNWRNNDGSPIDRTYFLTDTKSGSRPGIIIRGVKEP